MRYLGTWFCGFGLAAPGVFRRACGRANPRLLGYSPMHFNIPNALTWMRIVMIPLFVGVYYFPPTWLTLPQQNLSATVIFTVAALTDLLDGYLARKLNQVFAFGAFFDPVADKLIVAAAVRSFGSRCNARWRDSRHGCPR